MSDMIEQVAQAIDKAMSLLKDPVWADANERRKETCRAGARAAIEAMRQPTSSMKIAGDEEIPDNVGYTNDAKAVYLAMINEALK
jgi:hypothetical protein